MPTLYSLPPLLEEQKWILITAGKWFLRLAAAHLFSAGQEHPAACSPLWSLTLGNLATPKTHHSPTLRLILLILFHQRKSSLSLYDYDYSCQVEFTFQIVLLIPSSWNSSSRDITTTTGTSQSLPSWPGWDLFYHCLSLLKSLRPLLSLSLLKSGNFARLWHSSGSTPPPHCNTISSENYFQL